MLIRNAEIWGYGLADVRITGGRIAAIAPDLNGRPDFDAQGAALIPGLHDHHLHLAALAAKQSSIPCGPPEVSSAAELAAQLAIPGTGWIRGIGYHESLMGLPDAKALDRLVPHRPLRIQHRSGRMWLLNSLAMETLLAKAPAPPGLRKNGHLFEEDHWLRTAISSSPPDFGSISLELARYGITGITDMSPRNDPAMAAHFAAQMAGGMLRQHCCLAGALSLNATHSRWQLGPAKLHLHEAAMPDFDETCAFIAQAHASDRAVAVHCVSELELVFTLALFEAVGVMPGDRIEHASIASPDHVQRMADMGLIVCVQPHFIQERGDAYLRDVEPRHHADLYRLHSLAKAGITLVGGSDTPFGSPDPWRAMDAAVRRKTATGNSIGISEALTPEAALALYLADPADLSRQNRIAIGDNADLVLLSQPWATVRAQLTSSHVRATIIAGNCVYQAPF